MSFAVSPDLVLENCSSHTIINSDGTDGTLESMNIHCNIKNFAPYIYAHLIKTP